MKLLVFSDTHLTIPFEEKKYLLLRRIISDSDKVIINGDFWEGFMHTFDEFYNSPWSQLFPILKKKNTIYIYGNHDPKEYCDPDKIKEFSVLQTDKYQFTDNKKTYILEHGHRILPLENGEVDLENPHFRSTVKRYDLLERVLIKLFGNLYQYLILGLNSTIKKQIKKDLSTNEIFMFGHTHCAEFNHNSPFINSGVIKHGLAQYIYIENGRIIPMQERY